MCIRVVFSYITRADNSMVRLSYIRGLFDDTACSKCHMALMLILQTNDDYTCASMRKSQHGTDISIVSLFDQITG